MKARHVWGAAVVLLAVASGQLVIGRFAGQAAPTPLVPGQVVHQVYSLTSVTSPAEAEPVDPYHLPKAAYAPARATVDQWILIGPGARRERCSRPRAMTAATSRRSRPAT